MGVGLHTFILLFDGSLCKAKHLQIGSELFDPDRPSTPAVVAEIVFTSEVATTLDTPQGSFTVAREPVDNPLPLPVIAFSETHPPPEGMDLFAYGVVLCAEDGSTRAAFRCLEAEGYVRDGHIQYERFADYEDDLRARQLPHHFARLPPADLARLLEGMSQHAGGRVELTEEDELLVAQLRCACRIARWGFEVRDTYFDIETGNLHLQSGKVSSVTMFPDAASDSLAFTTSPDVEDMVAYVIFQEAGDLRSVNVQLPYGLAN